MNKLNMKVIIAILCIFLVVLLLCFSKSEKFKALTRINYFDGSVVDYSSSGKNPKGGGIFGDIDNGTYRNYIPQGFDLSDNYIYVSAYHKYASCSTDVGYVQSSPSIVLQISRNDYSLTNVYTLNNEIIGSHVGGLVVMEDTKQLFISSTMDTDPEVSGIGVYDIGDDGTLIQTTLYSDLPSVCCGETTKPSYLSYDKARGLLWFGRWDHNTDIKTTFGETKSAEEVCGISTGGPFISNWQLSKCPSICGQELNKNSQTNKYEFGKLKYQINLPVSDVQGIAFKKPPDKDNYVYLSVSYGGTNKSQIYKWKLPLNNTTSSDVKKLNSYGNDEPVSVASGAQGLENICFDENNKLWGISESGARYNKKRHSSCGGKEAWENTYPIIFKDIKLE